MNEELGFLETLAANPGDDVTRLVYADWLDEHGSVRGRYLRVEMELAGLAEDDERIPALEEELNQLRRECGEEWAKTAGKRWDVWLLGHRPSQKIMLIHIVRQHCEEVGSLKEAKDLVEAIPARVSGNRWRGEAESIHAQLLEAAHANQAIPYRSVALCPANSSWPRCASVAASWKRIDRWLMANAPGWAPLREGAADEAIKQAEAALGFPLPDDLRESYRAHDGSGHEAFFPAGLCPVLLPLALVVDDWRMWKEGGAPDDREIQAEKGIRCEWFNVRWVPFTSNGGGDYDCVDLAPAPGGKEGQLISLNHETGGHKLRAPSFGHYLHTFANALEAGVYRYEENPEYGCRLRPIRVDG